MQVQVFLSTASIFTLLSGLDNPDDDGDNAPAAPKRRRRCTAEMEPAPEAPPSATPAAPSSAANAADLDVADSLSSDNEFDFNFLFGSESEMLADPPKEHKKKKEKKKKDKKLRKKNKKKVQNSTGRTCQPRRKVCHREKSADQLLYHINIWQGQSDMLSLHNELVSMVFQFMDSG